MKKLFVFLFALFIMPVVTHAGSPIEDVDYEIKQIYYLVNIRDDGSADVKELIVFDGSFNGVYFNIYFNNPYLTRISSDYEANAIYNFDGISNIRVSAKKINKISFNTFDDKKFTQFDKVSKAEKGDSNKYTLDEDKDGVYIKAFKANNNGSVAFLVEYTLDNIVVMHPDVAEFYWQVLSASLDGDTDNDVKVRVFLPGSDTKETFRIWTHDVLDSNISYIKKNGKLIGFEVVADKVTNDDSLDVRTTFNKDLIVDSSNLDYFKGEGLNGILKVEVERAKEANELRGLPESHEEKIKEKNIDEKVNDKKEKDSDKSIKYLLYIIIGLLLTILVFIFIMFIGKFINKKGE